MTGNYRGRECAAFNGGNRYNFSIRFDPNGGIDAFREWVWMRVLGSILSRVHSSDGGIYVITSSFTREAMVIAHKFGVTLVDERLLSELCAEYA